MARMDQKATLAILVRLETPGHRARNHPQKLVIQLWVVGGTQARRARRVNPDKPVSADSLDNLAFTECQENLDKRAKRDFQDTLAKEVEMVFPVCLVLSVSRAIVDSTACLDCLE